jgi:hypothetical protein
MLEGVFGLKLGAACLIGQRMLQREGRSVGGGILGILVQCDQCFQYLSENTTSHPATESPEQVEPEGKRSERSAQATPVRKIHRKPLSTARYCAFQFARDHHSGVLQVGSGTRRKPIFYQSVRLFVPRVKVNTWQKKLT